MIEKLTARNNIVRLNHIGFCYKSDSIAVEKSKLIKSCLENKLHLYEEDSSDETRWYFIGNIKNDWQIPLIEYLLLEQTDDAWKDYWLPHVQIDIDTNLSDKEIEKELKVFFGNHIKPFKVTINGIIYIVRLRLGVVDGININLDFATRERRVQYHRQNLLKVIV